MKITNHDVSKVTTGANSPVDKAKDAAPIESIRPVSSGAEDKATGARLTLSGDLEEVGRIFKVTRERVRQIEAKAVRKLQHPVRSQQLEGFIERVAG